MPANSGVARGSLRTSKRNDETAENYESSADQRGNVWPSVEKEKRNELCGNEKEHDVIASSRPKFQGGAFTTFHTRGGQVLPSGKSSFGRTMSAVLRKKSVRHVNKCRSRR